MKSFIVRRFTRALPSRARIARVVVAIASVGFFATACDVHGISDAGSLTTILVTPNPQSLLVNSTQQFTAVGRDASGANVGITPTFSIVTGGGAITPAGMFTAGATPGTYTNTIKATSGSISGTATVTVTIGPLATITVTPNPATLGIGNTQQFVAVGRDAGGNVVAITPAWGIAASGGTVSATGLFTAGQVLGTFVNTVTATSGAIVGTATVVVTPGPVATIVVSPNPVTLDVNATQLFTAVARDVAGNVVTTTFVWSVTNGGGTIGAAGMFTAGATPGTFANTVRATSGIVFGTATVNVNTPPPVLATIDVTPNPATLNPGATQQFAAVARDNNGNVISITPVWSVVSGGGTINAVSGVFTAGAATGSFANTVRATSGTTSGFATVNVVAVPLVLTTITVTPNPVTLNPGATQQFTAVGRDQNNNIMAVTPTWTVINGGGTINAGSGLFTAGAAAGSFNNTVRATSGTISGTATVNVNSVLTTITVTPNPANLNANATQIFTAVGRNQNGTIVAITPVWSVVNGGGTINAGTGSFLAGAVAGTFISTVRATSGTVFGSATVNINAVPVVPPIVNLGTAAPNGIMAGTAFTCVINGVINANISISPGSTVTGFPPCVITGVQHLADAVALQAQIDLTAAYNVLAGLPCAPANAIVANLGGTTLAAGVYCTATSIGVTGNLILDGGGDPNATFVFQAGTSLITAGNVILINGAQARNVYWQVGSSATIGTASQWQGNILALTSITLVDNANLIGRALARNGAVSLGTNNVVTLP